jgi:NADH-ubiquinone oxidoreductase chain 6
MVNNLYILNETITNGYSTLILDLLSLISILCAVSVIISKNPIISVLFLIGLFLSIASYLIIIGISFIGLSYLLVYVGAVSILFLFILMLINVRVSELLNETSNSIPLVFIIAFSLNSILSKLLPENIYYLFNNNISFNNYSDYLNKSYKYINNEDKMSFITINSWDNNLAEVNHITSIGNIIYTNYSIWLILTSIILLLAMVGAIIITIKQKN